MQAMLFRVPAFNLAVLTGALCIMTLVSLAACLLPSQRAARISPMETLAEE
jgi:ABC-type lipoprotein release transport system permease subunit